MDGSRITAVVVLVIACFMHVAAADIIGFYPTKDTEIPSTLTGSDCGTIPPQLGVAQTMRVGREVVSKGTTVYRSLIHFNLSVIPWNSTVTGATLTFYVEQQTATSNFQVQILRLTQPAWRETDVNWQSYDCDPDPQKALFWCNAGGDFVSVDGVTWTTSGVGTKSVDITPLVQKAVGKPGAGLARASTSGQLHLVLKAKDDNLDPQRLIRVRTREYTAFKPQVAVTFTPPPTQSNPWVSFRDESAMRLATGCTELTPSQPLSEDDRMEKDFAAGDFDGDGDSDIIVVRRDPFEISSQPTARKPLLLINEGGVLVDRSNRLPPIVASARDVLVADLDGTNGPDIVIATTCNDPPKFFRNRGFEGTSTWQGFQDKTADWKPTNGAYGGYTVDGLRFCGIAGTDLDGDGDTDVYMVNYLTASCPEESPASQARRSDKDVLLMNKIAGPDATGRFVDESSTRLGANAAVVGFGTSAIVQDVNNDGKLDLVKTDTKEGPGTVALLNSGTATNPIFTGTRLTIASNPSPYHVAGGNLNGDGVGDFYVVDDRLDRIILGPVSTSDPPFQSPGPLANRTTRVGGNVKLGDVDGDGDLDVAVADVDQSFIDSCNVCFAPVCTLGCAGSANCGPQTFCTGSNHNQCPEENLNTKTCLSGFCFDETGTPACNSTVDCQFRVFTLLRNNGGALDEPWPRSESKNFHLRTYDFELLDLNSDGCRDLVMGTCSGYKVFIRNCP